MLKDRAVHYMVRWQQGPRQKNSVHRPGATQAASNESISLRKLAGVARGPVGSNRLKGGPAVPNAYPAVC